MMGFHSYLCAKTGKPVLHDQISDYYHRTFSKVVVTFKDRTSLRGDYDGYGRVASSGGVRLELSGLMNGPEKAPRIVLAAYYADEKWADLPPNEHDDGQGHFYSEDQLEQIFGLPPEGNELNDWRTMRHRFSDLEAVGQAAVDKVLGVVWPQLKAKVVSHEKTYPWSTKSCLDPAAVSQLVLQALTEAGAKIDVDARLAEAVDAQCLSGYIGEFRPTFSELAAVTHLVLPEDSSDDVRYYAAHESRRVIMAVIGLAVDRMDKLRETKVQALDRLECACLFLWPS